MNLHFLHGFLGLPSDWDSFKNHFSMFNLYFHDLEAFSHIQDFSIYKQNKEKNIIIGYSMGGRVALQTLLNNDIWDGAIIISAHPGLSSEEEKNLRFIHDSKWANRFLTDPWDQLMHEWNNQAVFKGEKKTLTRYEKDYKRENLSSLMLRFSLGKQQNLCPLLKNIIKPVLWLSGEYDKKFLEIGRKAASLNPLITHRVVTNSGHRVPWENSERFASLVQEFVARVS